MEIFWKKIGNEHIKRTTIKMSSRLNFIFYMKNNNDSVMKREMIKMATTMINKPMKVRRLRLNRMANNNAL